MKRILIESVLVTAPNVREGGDNYKVLLQIYMRIKPAYVDTLRCHIDSSLTLMPSTRDALHHT